jgi:hypothetical protein
MSIENHYILLFVAVIVAEIIASVLARRFITTKNQIKFGEELMMEAINLHLRKENQQLNAENQVITVTEARNILSGVDIFQ